MTLAAAVPVRHRTPRATSAVPLNAVRLLRVELRRNTMPWILPLIAALVWFDSYRLAAARRCSSCSSACSTCRARAAFAGPWP